MNISMAKDIKMASRETDDRIKITLWRQDREVIFIRNWKERIINQHKQGFKVEVLTFEWKNKMNMNDEIWCCFIK